MTVESGSESKRFVEMSKNEQITFAEEKLGTLIADPKEFSAEHGYVNMCIADVEVVPGVTGVLAHERQLPHIDKVDHIDPATNLVTGSTYWGREFKTIGAESEEFRALMACIGDIVPRETPDFGDGLKRVIFRLNIPGRPATFVTIVTYPQYTTDIEVSDETPTNISYRTSEIIVGFRIGV